MNPRVQMGSSGSHQATLTGGSTAYSLTRPIFFTSVQICDPTGAYLRDQIQYTSILSSDASATAIFLRRAIIRSLMSFSDWWLR